MPAHDRIAPGAGTVGAFVASVDARPRKAASAIALPRLVPLLGLPWVGPWLVLIGGAAAHRSTALQEEQARLTLQIDAIQEEGRRAARETRQAADVAGRLLQDLDIEHLWQAATETEKRDLIDELVDRVAVHPDHVEVSISGAARINVLLSEVGSKDSENGGVGGGT